jgi:hypothetical protein
VLWTLPTAGSRNSHGSANKVPRQQVGRPSVGYQLLDSVGDSAGMSGIVRPQDYPTSRRHEALDDVRVVDAPEGSERRCEADRRTLSDTDKCLGGAIANPSIACRQEPPEEHRRQLGDVVRHRRLLTENMGPGPLD